jgi:hypothetical protein
MIRAFIVRFWISVFWPFLPLTGTGSTIALPDVSSFCLPQRLRLDDEQTGSLPEHHACRARGVLVGTSPVAN